MFLNNKYYVSDDKKVVKHNFREFYNAHVRDEYKITERYEVDACIRLFLDKSRWYIINQPSGVYWKGIGYFYIHEVYNRKLWAGLRERTSSYFPAFIAERNSPLKNFTFDYNFNITLRKGLTQRLKNGARYLNWAYAVINKKIKK